MVGVTRPTFLNTITVAFRGIKLECRYDVDRKKLFYEKINDESYVWRLHEHLSPGSYTFPFHFLVRPLPATVRGVLSDVQYHVQATVSYTNTMAKLKEPVQLVRTPPPGAREYVVATGNWRDLLVYEFGLQSKVAFQGHPYKCSILIYPIGGARWFEVHAVSVLLVQACKIPRVASTAKTTESAKYLLFHREVTTSEMTWTSHYSLDISFTIAPTCLTYDELGALSPRSVYPSTESQGFEADHKLRLCLDICELQSPLPLPSEMGAVPGYATYHRRRSQALRFRRMEVLYAMPLTILPSALLQGLVSPPSYHQVPPPQELPPPMPMPSPPKYVA